MKTTFWKWIYGASALFLFVAIVGAQLMDSGPGRAAAGAFSFGRTYYASASGSGTACTNSSPCTLTTAMAKTDDYSTIMLRGGDYKLSAGYTVSRSKRLIGSGTVDQAGPATRIMFGVNANDGVVFAGAGPYTATVTGTVKGVYFDDATAYAATGSRGRPLKKTRNTGTPTTPAAGEWGQSGATLYLGDDPAGRTVRIVSGANAGFTIARGCKDFLLQGIEFGYTAGHGLYAPANQDSTQLNLNFIGLNNVSVFGCWDDTLGSGNMANSGIAVHAPSTVEANRLTLDYCDNDLVNLKQQVTFVGKSVFGQRAGDDCISPHYGSHIDLDGFEFRDPQQYAGADGDPITIYSGSSARLKNGTCFSTAGNGIYVFNGSALYPNSRLWAEDVVCSNGDWGTGATIGWYFQGRVSATLIRCKAIGYQNATYGFGFYLQDSSALNINSYLTMLDCSAVKCRASVRTGRDSATNTMRVDAVNFLHVDATAAEISNAGTAALTTGGTSTDGNAVAGVTLQSFWID